MNTKYVEELEEIIKRHTLKINKEMIGKHISIGDLTTWLYDWRFNFEVDIINFLDEIKEEK